MSEYISLDSHKHYSLLEREDVQTGRVRQQRIEHRPGAIRECLGGCGAGTAVAVEALGSWYWIVQEIEQAGLAPLLVHPRKAKLMMGMLNKTDKLDVHGLNRLQRNGTLPTVWIAPRELRDLRELTRTRMVLTRQRARLKNRLGSALAKYGLEVSEYSDAYGRGARPTLEALLGRLPEQTSWTSRSLLEQLDFVQAQIERHERRLAGLLEETAALRRQRTLPGFGPILSAVVVLEMGDAGRFPDAEHFASYAGTTPRVHSSGDKTRYGRLRPDVNRYLKWAFVEAANVVARHHASWPGRHVSRLYERLKFRRGGAKAIGAVARHLAEATYYVQRLGEEYRDPGLPRVGKEGLSATMP
jgi:transposase